MTPNSRERLEDKFHLAVETIQSLTKDYNTELDEIATLRKQLDEAGFTNDVTDANAYNKEALLDEIARLTTELAQEKRNTNFTYTAERQRLRKENEELRAKLADVEQCRCCYICDLLARCHNTPGQMNNICQLFELRHEHTSLSTAGSTRPTNRTGVERDVAQT